MRKTKLMAMLSAIILTFLLFGQMAFQAYATTTPTTVLTTMHFNDDWSGRINGKLLQIQRNFTMQRIDTLQYGMQFTQLNASGWIKVNGEKIGFQFETTKYPTYKIYSVLNDRIETTSSNPVGVLSLNPVRYAWDGITFISTDSQPLHVEYSHPDNGPYEPPTYDIPPNEADPTTLRGNKKKHHHIPKWSIEDMIATGTLTSLAGAIGALLVTLLGIPEAISKAIALFVAVIAGVIAVLGVGARAFAESVLKTELGDGWTWVWGQGKWWIFCWWWQSFGKWRDWGFFFTSMTWRTFSFGGGGGSNYLRVA